MRQTLTESLDAPRFFALIKTGVPLSETHGKTCLHLQKFTIRNGFGPRQVI